MELKSCHCTASCKRWYERLSADSGENAERDYHLIMKGKGKGKETLLDFESPLKFIFSHSALKESWDNPIVFQMGALREKGAERKSRR